MTTKNYAPGRSLKKFEARMGSISPARFRRYASELVDSGVSAPLVNYAVYHYLSGISLENPERVREIAAKMRSPKGLDWHYWLEEPCNFMMGDNGKPVSQPIKTVEARE